MIIFNTEVAKHANNILYNKDINLAISDAESSLKDGLITQDEKGNSLLHYLCTKNMQEPFSKFLSYLFANLEKYGYNDKSDLAKYFFNLPNHKGTRIAHIIFGFNSFNLLEEFIINHEIDLFCDNISGVKPIELAVKSDNIDIIRLTYELVSSGKIPARIFDDFYRGYSLMHLSIKHESKLVFKFLLKKSEFNYLEKLDYYKNSALHLAVQASEDDLAIKLIENNIDLSLKNGHYKTALDIAYELEKYDIVYQIIKKQNFVHKNFIIKAAKKSIEQISKLVLHQITDKYGSFVGITSDEKRIDIFKQKIIEILMIVRLDNKDNIIKKSMSMINNMIKKLYDLNSKKLSIGTNKSEIKKNVTPILNEFIKEVSYV